MEYKGYKSQALDFTVYQDGEKGDTGTSVVSIKTTYVLQANTVNLTTWNQADLDKLDWTDTPPSLQLDHTIWKRETTTFSNGEIETAPPIKDEALNSTYKLAQGKTTNYYGPNDPTTSEESSHTLKTGDCWFDTSFQPTERDSNLTFKQLSDYINYYIKTDYTKIRHFIPVTRPDGNGTSIGLLDLMENKFYENEGTGTFIAGPSLGKQYIIDGATYEELLYIESTGLEHIDTRVKPTKETIWYLDGQFTTIPRVDDEQRGVMGAAAEYSTNSGRDLKHFHIGLYLDKNNGYHPGIGRSGSNFAYIGDGDYDRHTFILSTSGKFLIDGNKKWEVSNLTLCDENEDLPDAPIWLFKQSFKQVDGTVVAHKSGFHPGFRLYACEIHKIKDSTESTDWEKVTTSSLLKLAIAPGITEAYTTGQLKQWDGTAKAWVDIGGELVTNKLTANYINTLDITTKKITVFDNKNKTIFNADAGTKEVSIGRFNIQDSSFIGGDASTDNYVKFTVATPFNEKAMSSTTILIKNDKTDEKKQLFKFSGWNTVTAGTLSQCVWDPAAYSTYKFSSSTITDDVTSFDNASITATKISLNSDLLKSAYKEACGYNTTEFDLNIDFKLFLGQSSPSMPATINDPINKYNSEIFDCLIVTAPIASDKANNIDSVISDSGASAFLTLSNGSFALNTLALNNGLNEYGRVSGPKKIGNKENLEEISFTNIPVTDSFYVFRIAVQRNSINTDEVITYKDSAGNTRTTVTTESTTVASDSYLVFPEELKISPNVLEIGSKLKIKPDGTVYANTINVDNNLSAKYGTIGGFNFSNNVMQSRTLTLTNSSVGIPPYKPLIIGKDSVPEAGLTIVSEPDFSAENNGTRVNTLKTNHLLVLSAGGSTSAKDNASITLSSKLQNANEFTKTTFETTITWTTSTSTSAAGVSADYGIMPTAMTDKNLAFTYESGGGGGGSIPKYTTTVVLNATTNITSIKNESNADVTLTPEAYTITVPIYAKIGSSWLPYTFTFYFKKGSTSATVVSKNTTLSDWEYSVAPVWYGVASSNTGTPSTVSPYKVTTVKTYSSKTLKYVPIVDINGGTSVQTLYNVSDQRLKTNITPIKSLKQLNEFYQQIEPVYFNFKNSLDICNFGFIAQDLQETFKNTLQTEIPNKALVGCNPSTGYFTVNYTDITALNTAQIKELLERVEKLEAQLSNITTKKEEQERP